MLLDRLGTDENQIPYANFHLALLKELCEKTGYQASEQDLLIFSEEGLSDLEKLEGKTFEQTLLIPLTGRRRDRIIRSYLKYLEYHLDTPLHIQSLDVLTALFA